jgi:hypothetical protein
VQQIVAQKPKVLFFSFVGQNYSRSSTILNYESRVFQKKFVQLPVGFIKSTKAIISKIQEIRTADYLVVMSPCHIITPILKLLSRKQVVLDAGWSLTDGQLSRGLSFRNVIKLVQIYSIDFLAFHSARKIIVESEIQRIRTSRIFLIPKRNIEVNFTGLDESAFVGNSHDSERLQDLDKKLEALGLSTTVLFRGKINNESGILNILDAASRLEERAAFIIVCGKNDVLLKLPPNVILLSDLTSDELKLVYQKSDLTLGQISNHPRLNYTIPHKAFEAGFFAKAYLTANTTGIRELYDPDSICLIDDVSGSGLAAEIDKVSDATVRSEFARRIRIDYDDKASQEVLNSQFELILQNL